MHSPNHRIPNSGMPITAEPERMSGSEAANFPLLHSMIASEFPRPVPRASRSALRSAPTRSTDRRDRFSSAPATIMQSHR